MKKTLTSTLALALLVLGIAGFAWAAQPAAETPDAAVLQQAPEQAPAEVVPGQEEEIALEELFQDPAEVGACCVAECWEQKSACWESCPPYGDPGYMTCRNNCQAEYEACRSHC